MVATSITNITAKERADPNGQFRAARNWLTM
jgi:hypothetical protein